MLDSRGPQARKSAYAMVSSLVASGLLFLATQLAWIRDTIPVIVNAFSARTGVGFGVSLLNIGSGIIIGLRISASMLIGGLIGWVLAPPLLQQYGWIAADARRVDILLTTMWFAVGMLIAGGITGLALRWRVLIKSFQGLAATGTSLDLPLKWVWLGGGGSALCLAVINHVFFGTPYWHSAIAIALAMPLGLVALRVLGETNWGPISTMVNLVQALFGAIAPGDLRASMVSSGVTGAVAAESEGLMQDFRAGQMINSTPRILTYMQLIAVPVGALALAFMYPLLRDTYGIIGEHAQLLSPTSQRWVGFAKVVTRETVGDGADERGGAGPVVVDAGLVCRRRAGGCGVDGARAEQGVDVVDSLADGHGHRDADSVQRGRGDLRRGRGRPDLAEGLPGESRTVFDSDRVGPHRRGGAGRGGDSAAGDAGGDEAAVGARRAEPVSCLRA